MKMSYPQAVKKGKYIIISNEEFNGDYVPKRLNAAENVKIIHDTFKRMDFTECNTFKNSTADEIFRIVPEAIRDNFDDHRCLFVFILTHGFANYQLCAWDKKYTLKDLVDKLPSLNGKPIIFVIQACSGSKFDHGSTSDQGAIQGPQESKPSGSLFYLAKPDLLFAFPSTPGIISYRPRFIPAFCELFEERHMVKDIHKILAQTAESVAEKPFVYVENGKNKVTQAPMTVSTLTKTLIFNN